MLRITRAQNGEVILKLSGRMDAENLSELETLLRSEPSGCSPVLDLTDLALVDQDAVSFLGRCETDGMQLRNCPPYIREWINQEDP
jgi:anti-anti-sigma regulatory factor